MILSYKKNKSTAVCARKKKDGIWNRWSNPNILMMPEFPWNMKHLLFLGIIEVLTEVIVRNVSTITPPSLFRFQHKHLVTSIVLNFVEKNNKKSASCEIFQKPRHESKKKQIRMQHVHQNKFYVRKPNFGKFYPQTKKFFFK